MECARPILRDSRYNRRHNATKLRCGACANHHLRQRESRSNRPVRALKRTANGPTSMTENYRLWKASLASSDISRILCRSHRARTKISGTFAKPANCCHLLPFRRRKIATLDSTVAFHFFPKEGVLASLGPAAENRERRYEEPRCQAVIEGQFCPMTSESAGSHKMLLAAAIAEGTPVATCASSNEVPARVAFRWANEPEVRA